MSAAISVQVRTDVTEGAMTVADVRAWLARWDQLTDQLGGWADQSMVTCRSNAVDGLLGMYAIIPPEPPPSE